MTCTKKSGERALGKSKLSTYLGFCIRSGKISFGVDNAEKERRDVFLLLVDEKLGRSSLNTVMKVKEKFACPLVIFAEGELGALLGRESVKAVAIKDKNLAEAIEKECNGDPQCKLYSGGNN